MTHELLRAAEALQPHTVALRRQLHRRPELGLRTPNTRVAVLAALDGLPLDITLHETTSGIAALLTAMLWGDVLLSVVFHPRFAALQPELVVMMIASLFVYATSVFGLRVYTG